MIPLHIWKAWVFSRQKQKSSVHIRDDVFSLLKFIAECDKLYTPDCQQFDTEVWNMIIHLRVHFLRKQIFPSALATSGLSIFTVSDQWRQCDIVFLAPWMSSDPDQIWNIYSPWNVKLSISFNVTYKIVTVHVVWLTFYFRKSRLLFAIAAHFLTICQTWNMNSFNA